MNGNIELSNEGPPTSPLQATAPPGLSDANNKVSIFPLTTSTPKSHMGFPIGALDTSESCSLEIISVAPSPLSKSFCESLPVTAVTVEPSFDNSIKAIEPTPPVEPVTIEAEDSNPLLEL